MDNHMYPEPSIELHRQRKELAPATAAAFKAFSDSVFADGALSAKTKDLIAVAVAHVTQCPYCIRGHTASALRKGATQQEVMEAILRAEKNQVGAAPMHTRTWRSTR